MPTRIVYFDEVRKTKKCEKLRLEELGYNCSDLKNQEMSKIDTENSSSEEDDSNLNQKNKYRAVVKNKTDSSILIKAEGSTKETAEKEAMKICIGKSIQSSFKDACYVHYSGEAPKF